MAKIDVKHLYGDIATAIADITSAYNWDHVENDSEISAKFYLKNGCYLWVRKEYAYETYFYISAHSANGVSTEKAVYEWLALLTTSKTFCVMAAGSVDGINAATWTQYAISNGVNVETKADYPELLTVITSSSSVTTSYNVDDTNSTNTAISSSAIPIDTGSEICVAISASSKNSKIIAPYVLQIHESPMALLTGNITLDGKAYYQQWGTLFADY